MNINDNAPYCGDQLIQDQASSFPAYSYEIPEFEALENIIDELKKYVKKTKPGPEKVLDCATQFFLIRQGMTITLPELRTLQSSESAVVISDSPNNVTRIQFHFHKKYSESSTSGGNVLSPTERQPGSNSNTEVEADPFTSDKPSAAHHGLFFSNKLNDH